MTDIFAEPTTPKLEDLMGEGKKYADADAIAKAIVEKDAFIARLQQEAKDRAADFERIQNERAFEDQMKARREAEQANREEPTPRDPNPPAPTVTPNDLEQAVQKAIAAREAQNARSRNLMTVKEKLTEALGEGYATTVKQRAAELQLGTDYLNELAATAPQAFFALIGLDRQRTVDNPAPPQTRQNTAAFRPEGSRKNKAYYDNLRKTNPGLYWSPAVQMEEYNELKRQGAEQFGL